MKCHANYVLDAAARHTARFDHRARERAEIMKTANRHAIGAAITAALCATASPCAIAHDDLEGKLGRVHFDTSCNEAAQRHFDRGMLYQHSFWYREARQAFEEALAADPGCAIANYGVALSLLLNPHTVPPAPNLAAGLAALEKGKAPEARTQRERDYIEALFAFYREHDTVAHGQRVQRYLAAQQSVAQRYPDDDEAQIAYAITLNVAASPNDKTYARQLEGAALLEPIFKRQPHHPGVAHYLVHLYDYPPIAEKGLDAAIRYSQIAPAAPHALHMPSHIFTRVGYWKDSIASNTASTRAAKEGKEPHDQLHAMDYMVYAHLQLAQDREARAVVDEMVDLKGYSLNIRTGPYAVAASQARYAIERGDWKAAANLPVVQTKFAYVEAIPHFARALGAARSGNADAAKADVGRLAELGAALRLAKDAYWAEQVEIQWQAASAWVLFAEGKHAEALKSMAAAADAEDKTEKSVVTPGPLVPTRELYARMLLERGMAREALAQYEAVLQKEPNRFNAYAGAGEAATAAGDTEKARHYAEKLVALTGGAGSDRAAIAAARELLARRR